MRLLLGTSEAPASSDGGLTDSQLVLIVCLVVGTLLLLVVGAALLLVWWEYSWTDGWRRRSTDPSPNGSQAATDPTAGPDCVREARDPENPSLVPRSEGQISAQISSVFPDIPDDIPESPSAAWGTPGKLPEPRKTPPRKTPPRGRTPPRPMAGTTDPAGGWPHPSTLASSSQAGPSTAALTSYTAASSARAGVQGAGETADGAALAGTSADATAAMAAAVAAAAAAAAGGRGRRSGGPQLEIQLSEAGGSRPAVVARALQFSSVQSSPDHSPRRGRVPEQLRVSDSGIMRSNRSKRSSRSSSRIDLTCATGFATHHLSSPTSPQAGGPLSVRFHSTSAGGLSVLSPAGTPDQSRLGRRLSRTSGPYPSDTAPPSSYASPTLPTPPVGVPYRSGMRSGGDGGHSGGGGGYSGGGGGYSGGGGGYSGGGGGYSGGGGTPPRFPSLQRVASPSISPRTSTLKASLNPPGTQPALEGSPGDLARTASLSQASPGSPSRSHGSTSSPPVLGATYAALPPARPPLPTTPNRGGITPQGSTGGVTPQGTPSTGGITPQGTPSTGPSSPGSKVVVLDGFVRVAVPAGSAAALAAGAAATAGAAAGSPQASRRATTGSTASPSGGSQGSTSRGTAARTPDAKQRPAWNSTPAFSPTTSRRAARNTSVNRISSSSGSSAGSGGKGQGGSRPGSGDGTASTPPAQQSGSTFPTSPGGASTITSPTTSSTRSPSTAKNSPPLADSGKADAASVAAARAMSPAASTATAVAHAGLARPSPVRTSVAEQASTAAPAAMGSAAGPAAAGASAGGAAAAVGSAGGAATAGAPAAVGSAAGAPAAGAAAALVHPPPVRTTMGQGPSSSESHALPAAPLPVKTSVAPTGSTASSSPGMSPGQAGAVFMNNPFGPVSPATLQVMAAAARRAKHLSEVRAARSPIQAAARAAPAPTPADDDDFALPMPPPRLSQEKRTGP